MGLRCLPSLDLGNHILMVDEFVVITCIHGWQSSTSSKELAGAAVEQAIIGQDHFGADQAVEDQQV